MSAFGDRLRETRETRGLSLEAVAEATRIARRHLVALERGDLEALPAGPFAKGYIEAYAQFLGIDPTPILEAYRTAGRQRGLGTPEAQNRIIEEFSQLVEQRAATTGRPKWHPAGRQGLALALAVAGLLGFGGWLLVRARAPRPAVAPSPRMQGEDSPEIGVRSEPRPQAAQTPRGTDAELQPDSSSLPEVDRGIAPPAVPTATSEAAAAEANPNIEVSDSGVGTGVENHRLVGQGDRFPEGSEVVFWTRVLGGAPGNVIHHVWLHEGRGIARIPLRIGGSHWRTYSRRLLPRGAAGLWTAEARGVDGRVLARREFLCVPQER